MSVGKTVLRLMGVPDEERSRSEILLAMDGANRMTGYEILRAIKERTNGKALMGPATLHRTLGKMVDAGLVDRRIKTTSGLSGTEEARTLFGLTAAGEREAGRIIRQVEEGRST